MQPRTYALSAFAVGAPMAFGVAAMAADQPKQGTDSFTAVMTSLNPIQQGDRVFATYELEGVVRNDTGAPMFDSFGQRCVGIAELLSNEVQNGLGSCTFTDRAGDHIFGRYKFTQGGKDGEHGAYELIGGSGKFAGITGTGEYLSPNLPPIKADDKAPRGVVSHKTLGNFRNHQ